LNVWLIDCENSPRSILTNSIHMIIVEAIAERNFK